MIIRSILLAGTPFYGYLDSVADGFRRAGIEVETLPYWDFTRGFLGTLRRAGMPVQRWAAADFLRRILRQGRRHQAVLFWRGDILTAEEILTIRRHTGAPVATWLIDSVKRMRLPVEAYRAFDRVFCYNASEVALLGGAGAQAAFLPLAFDPRYYHPAPDTAKDLDLYFVGNMHRERMALLEAFLTKAPERRWRIAIHGRLFSRHDPLANRRLKAQFPQLTRHLIDCEATHSLINRYTNRSRICLNILPSQADSALNVRAFEICGSGGLQLLSRNSILKELFEEDRDLAAFSDLDELHRRVEDLLASPPKADAMAAAGHQRALRDHTFESRARTILQWIQ